MSKLKNGVYFINSKNGKIVSLSNVRIHEGIFDREKNIYYADKVVAIVTWEDEIGVFERTMINGKDFNNFIYIGEL